MGPAREGTFEKRFDKIPSGEGCPQGGVCWLDGLPYGTAVGGDPRYFQAAELITDLRGSAPSREPYLSAPTGASNDGQQGLLHHGKRWLLSGEEFELKQGLMNQHAIARHRRGTA